MSNGNGHRWSKFWWRDHQGDAALRSCSLAARGFWMELLCIAHEADPIGHVLLNGKIPDFRQLSSIIGCKTAEARRCLDELESAGVFSRNSDGSIFCRRMVRDAEVSDIGREHIEKRWRPETTDPNRVATRKPNGEATREATRVATRTPITKKQSTESEADSPSPYPSQGRGIEREAPGFGTRENETNPRALGTNPRANGTNPRTAFRNGFIQVALDAWQDDNASEDLTYGPS